MQSILKTAGPYDVEWIPCPHYAGPADFTCPATGVLHTTEGGFEGSLAIFKKHYAPHFVISASIIAQLVPIGLAGAALVTHNNKALVQIEMVGFSKATPWSPDAETTHRVAAVMASCWKLFGIPLFRSWKDGDFGRSGDNPHRHADFWGKVPGWFGHGDCPDNAHWDPGNLNWSTLFTMAKSLGTILADPSGPTGHSGCPVTGDGDVKSSSEPQTA